MGVSDKALEQFLDFCNNSVPSSGKWGRRDPSMSPEESLAEAQDLLRLCLFYCSIPAYNESRILRYLDCCLFWARWQALCPFGKQIWDSVQFAQCKKVGPQADGLRQENSVRLQRARTFAANPRCRTLSLIFYACMQVTEGLVHLFFYINTDAMDVVSALVDEATARDSVGAINAGTNKAATRRRKKKKQAWDLLLMQWRGTVPSYGHGLLAMPRRPIFMAWPSLSGPQNALSKISRIALGIQLRACWLRLYTDSCRGTETCRMQHFRTRMGTQHLQRFAPLRWLATASAASAMSKPY